MHFSRNKHNISNTFEGNASFSLNYLNRVTCYSVFVISSIISKLLSLSPFLPLPPVKKKEQETKIFSPIKNPTGHILISRVRVKSSLVNGCRANPPHLCPLKLKKSFSSRQCYYAVAHVSTTFFQIFQYLYSQKVYLVIYNILSIFPHSFFTFNWPLLVLTLSPSRLNSATSASWLSTE